MSSGKFSLENKYDIWIYSILILSSFLAAFLAVSNIIIATDSMRYGLVSQQIINGQGLRIPVIRFDSGIPVDGTMPFLEQPPLMPILLAVLGGISSKNYLAGQILNVVSHVAIAIFSFMIMKILCDKKTALFTGILISFSLPLLIISHHILSESLFIAFTVASIYFLMASRHPGRQRTGLNHILAGICASLAILTRYAGIVLIGMFIWEACVLMKNKKIKSAYKYFIPALLLPVITIAALFMRNYLHLGTFRGDILPVPERTFFEAVKGVLKMVFVQFQLGRNSGTLLFIFIMSFILYILAHARLRKDMVHFFSAGLDFVIIFICTYLLLIFLTLAKDMPYFELRYVSPLVPFLFILCVFIVVFVWERVEYRRATKLSLYGLILSLALIAAGNIYKTSLNLPEFFYKQIEGGRIYSLLDSCAYNWIIENYEKDMIIVTNKPYHFSFFGGYPSVFLPNRKWFPNAWVPKNMEDALPDRMREVQAKGLALFEDAEEQYYGGYIAGLFSQREDNDSFTLAYECPDGVVYRLKD